MKKYLFYGKEDAYQIGLIGNFILANWDYIGIYILDKDLRVIDRLFIEEGIVVNKILESFDGVRVALYCPENRALFIINLSTKDIKRITIPHDLKLEDGCLSPFYYWIDSIFVIRSHHDEYFEVSTTDLKIEVRLKTYIEQYYPDFYCFITKAETLKPSQEVVTVIPKLYQFSYKDSLKKEIGFIDNINDLHIVSAYEGDDTHAIYFINKKFIIVHCDAIEKVINNSKKIIYRCDKSCEFRRSAPDISLQTVYVVCYSWGRNDMEASLLAIAVK